jgi:hypothetical protein
LLIASLALSPIVLSVFAWQCSPVFFHLKAWEVEYTFEKGVCNLSEPRIEQAKNNKRNYFFNSF